MPDPIAPGHAHHATSTPVARLEPQPEAPPQEPVPMQGLQGYIEALRKETPPMHPTLVAAHGMMTTSRGDIGGIVVSYLGGVPARGSERFLAFVTDALGNIRKCAATHAWIQWEIHRRRGGANDWQEFRRINPSSLDRIAQLLELAQAACEEGDLTNVGRAMLALKAGVDKLREACREEASCIPTWHLFRSYIERQSALENAAVQQNTYAFLSCPLPPGVEQALQAGTAALPDVLAKAAIAGEPIVPTPAEQRVLAKALWNAFEESDGSMNISQALQEVEQKRGSYSRDRMAQFTSQPEVIGWIEAGFADRAPGLYRFRVYADQYLAAFLAGATKAELKPKVEVSVLVQPFAEPQAFDLCVAAPETADRPKDQRLRVWVEMAIGPAAEARFKIDECRGFELLSASGLQERRVPVDERMNDGTTRTTPLGYEQSTWFAERLRDRAVEGAVNFAERLRDRAVDGANNVLSALDARI